jgi:hypothetical protein
MLAVAGIGAGIARPRADERDDAGENAAQQRKENDGLVHRRLSPSSD